MRRFVLRIGFLLLGLVACGGGSGSPDDGADLPADVVEAGGELVPDGAGTDAEAADGPGETPADAEPPADLPGDSGDAVGDDDGTLPDPGPPDPAKVFVVRTRPACQPDGPWTVDTVTQFRTADVLPDTDVRAVAAPAGHAWAATPSGLYHLVPGGLAFVVVANLPGEGTVAALAPRVDGGTWVARGTGIGALEADGSIDGEWAAGTAAVTRVFDCDGAGWAIADGALRVAAGSSLVAASPAPPGTVHDGACAPDGNAWAGTSEGLFRLKDGTWQAAWTPASGAPVTAVAIRGGRVAAAAGDQVATWDPASLASLATPQPAILAPGPGGLPTGAVTALDLSDDGTLLAVGHATGASLLDLGTGKADHFVSGRWLPANAAAGIALSGGTAPDLWVATSAGASRLRKADLLLRDKADRMFGQLNRWFWRLEGFVSAWAGFTDPWSDQPSPLRDDDNDGQWTQEAVGAFCYAYAVTGDDKWYQAARRAMLNMALQIDIPAADFVAAGLGRGFVTRSFVRDDEGEVFASKATQSNWHLTTFTDGHQYYWKDDTSSDEVTGHLFGFSLYYDLCAKDDAERAFVADHLGALAGYILDHGFTLPDLDGQPTTHGNWSPSRIPIVVDGLEACADAGNTLEACVEAWGGAAHLDGQEILALMLAAWHVTGQDRFLAAYESLFTDHRYGEAVRFHENVVTWTIRASVNYCDHELADLALLALIRYEPYPDRRQFWIDQVMAGWAYETGERNPLKSLVIASAMPDVPGLANGTRTLADYPEDLREWRIDNAHRADYLRDVNDRFDRPQFQAVPPHDEIPIQRWDHNPYRVADGGDGATRMAPNFWLLPYWGLRYVNAICP